uniref:Hyaluronan mediated motility receptor-like n=1 Tax=Saccoglossus kowalevskii TaxID=10224 RepID=A0ABM0LW02_SACKO|nr:PREDICTED: hyaluronan mediated motility receptor-like [Saccoglossus kowalevskii]
MSFSKSAVKRFNDITSCAPAPGTYNVKVVQKSTRPVVFEKSDRFKACKESVGSCHSELDTSTCSSYLSTPSKKLFASPFQRAPNSLRSLNKKISASCENIVSKKHANLAAELEDRDQKIAELQLRVKCAENELLVLQCNIDRLTDSNSKLEADKTESLMCCEKMKQEITELEGLTDKLKEENENLQQKLSTREESLALSTTTVTSHDTYATMFEQ